MVGPTFKTLLSSRDDSEDKTGFLAMEPDDDEDVGSCVEAKRLSTPTTSIDDMGGDFEEEEETKGNPGGGKGL